jgi:hypothetical protein
MLQEVYREETTWKLAGMLYDGWQFLLKFERYSVGWRRFTPWLLWNQRHLSQVQNQVDQVGQVLENRYRGVIAEVTAAVGGASNQGLAADALLRALLLGIWRRVILVRFDWVSFSEVLWLCVLDELEERLTGCDLRLAEPLKPKFMLRQFVDELEATEGRGVLRAHLYSGLDPAQQPLPEVEMMLREAYVSLHGVVQHSRRGLGPLTGNSVNITGLRGLDDVRSQYAEWLGAW